MLRKFVHTAPDHGGRKYCTIARTAPELAARGMSLYFTTTKVLLIFRTSYSSYLDSRNFCNGDVMP